MTEFLKVAQISDLNPGEKMLVEYDDEDVGLFNIDGEFYAISDVCTHDNGPLVEGSGSSKLLFGADSPPYGSAIDRVDCNARAWPPIPCPGRVRPSAR